MKGTIKWREGMKFEAYSTSGHTIIMDAAPEVGGSNQGPRPMELVLLALGGCTAMDVISILKKMRKEIESFEIKLEAERAEEHPKVFTNIKVLYTLKGKNLKEAEVERAMNLSKDKYCSVGRMLNKVAKLAYQFLILNS
ncbi:MAG: OsmC family protein [Acidobacteriota bacterium]